MWVPITSFNNDCNQAGRIMLHCFSLKKGSSSAHVKCQKCFIDFIASTFDLTAKITCFMTTMIDENSGGFNKSQ